MTRDCIQAVKGFKVEITSDFTLAVKGLKVRFILGMTQDFAVWVKETTFYD